MHVVATAGHVDHGKSTLVEALTGMVPDRLAEERRRGLSIELGYCWTSLPPVGDVAFVDVPGHERFISTTLSGVGPVPTVLLVVAADDPWMPQAAEHLAALDALGVSHGVLAVTRCDLADPQPALARARHELARTTLRDVPAVAVSGRTGAGLDELRAALVAQLQALPAPDPAADVRLWVDRRFHVRGTGTVVTGTLPAGTVTVGDVLEADGTSVRVRGIECLAEPTGAVSGVARVALDLGGKAAVERGGVLVTPEAFTAAGTVDVRLRGEGRVPERPLLHVGATAVAVHARPLAGDVVRLRLERSLPLRIGDRALVRDPGSRRVWGALVLDPAPPPLRRRGAAAARAEELADADGSARSEVDRRGVVRRPFLRRVGAAGPLPPDALAVGDWLVSAERAAQLREQLARAVAAASTPARPGVPVAQLARDLRLPDERLVVALVGPALRLRGADVEPVRAAGLPEALERALAVLRSQLSEAPFAAPDADGLRELGLDTRGIATLARAGELLKVADGVVLLPGADELAVQRLATLPAPFTTSQARQALGTSRRVALPLLAHLDRSGRTVRLADDRRRLR